MQPYGSQIGAFHQMLRQSQASGYPNMSYFQPNSQGPYSFGMPFRAPTPGGALGYSQDPRYTAELDRVRQLHARNFDPSKWRHSRARRGRFGTMLSQRRGYSNQTMPIF